MKKYKFAVIIVLENPKNDDLIRRLLPYHITGIYGIFEKTVHAIIEQKGENFWGAYHTMRDELKSNKDVEVVEIEITDVLSVEDKGK